MTNEDYKFLNDRYVTSNSKVDVINGLLIAQAICGRVLIEGHSEQVLEVMGNIVKAIESIKNSEVKQTQNFCFQSKITRIKIGPDC